MRGQTQRSTAWTCDACGVEVVLTGNEQDVPPKGWRLIGLWPTYVNMALEANSKQEIARAAICPPCFVAPVIISDVFYDNV